MDGQHRQDERNQVLKHGSITQAVIGCAFEVINELGAGFLESVYEKAMLVALRQKGLGVQAQQITAARNHHRIDFQQAEVVL